MLVAGCTIKTSPAEIAEECKDGNYLDLSGPENQHRHIDYRVDYAFTPLKSHDKKEEFDFKWFRFNVNDTATRMLERREVSDLFMKEKVCVFTVSLNNVIIRKQQFNTIPKMIPQCYKGFYLSFALEFKISINFFYCIATLLG